MRATYADGLCGHYGETHGAHDWQTGVANGSMWFHCPGVHSSWERANREALR